MKNLIDPKVLAELKREPVSYERIAGVLENNKQITAARLCKLVDVDPQQFYNWRSKNAKRASSANGDDFDVVPTGADKKSYSANDKLKLVKRYSSLEGDARAELLRKYGLYDSDFTRWLDKTDSAALAALSTRKPRSDKKSPERLEIERMKSELRSHEKTIAKLSGIVVAQKKISDLLRVDDFD